MYTYNGKLVQQFVVFYYNNPFSEWINGEKELEYYTKVKLYKGELASNEVEFDVFMGRIPIYNLQPGRELTVNFLSSIIHAQKKFYTDSNGLRMVERCAIKEKHDESDSGIFG